VNKEIIIKPFEKNHLEDVIELSSNNLWLSSSKEVINKFIHTNFKNPIQRYRPVGVVALDNNKVVGYRGFVSSLWQINQDVIKVLYPSSVNVHNEYRRLGLFSKMTNACFELYSESYDFFLNTSSNTKSTPGYIKSKWIVLGEKDYLYKFANPLSMKKQNPTYQVRISDKVPFKEICAINEYSTFQKNNIKSYIRSHEYASWLFHNPFYKFVIIEQNTKPLSYCCFTIKGNTCSIIDFDMINSSKELLEIILNTIRKKYNNKLFNCYLAKNSSAYQNAFKKSGFITSNISPIRKIFKKELTPFLIRPVKKNYLEDDYLINNIDLRNFNKWIITWSCDF